MLIEVIGAGTVSYLSVLVVLIYLPNLAALFERDVGELCRVVCSVCKVYSV